MHRYSTLGLTLATLATASCDDAPRSGSADVDVPSDAVAPDAADAHTLEPRACGDTRLAPPPVAIDDHVIVPIDVTALAASMTFDPINKVASVTAHLTFRVGPTAGWPVFDLRQTVLAAELDGLPVPLSDLSRQTLSPDDPLGVMLFGQDLEPCSEHVLSLAYELATLPLDPSSPIPKWTDQGVLWHSAFSDMNPGEYLERWFPAPLLHDDFAMILDIDVLGDSPHTLLSNGTVTNGPNTWHITFPSDTDATLPLLYLAPSTTLTIAHSDSTLVLVDAGLLPSEGPQLIESAKQTALATLASFTTRFGARPDASPFLLIVGVDGLTGMEYRNAALVGHPHTDWVEHEILHAWFARDVRSARHVDAWLDEGIVTHIVDYPNASPIDGPSESPFPRLGSGNRWTRNTLDGAHGIGSRLMASLDAHFGSDATDQVLRDLVRDCAGHHITHHDLRRAFAELGDAPYVDDLWTTYVLADWDHAYLSGDCPRWQ